jgi:hypothetical protein
MMIEVTKSPYVLTRGVTPPRATIGSDADSKFSNSTPWTVWQTLHCNFAKVACPLCASPSGNENPSWDFGSGVHPMLANNSKVKMTIGFMAGFLAILLQHGFTMRDQFHRKRHAGLPEQPSDASTPASQSGSAHSHTFTA